MATTISLTYNKVKYKLEYTRNSVKEMEESGFVFGDLDAKPVSSIPVLFHGAFLANHPTADESEINEIYDNLTGKKDLITVLIKMYNDTVQTLIAEPTSDEGNISWRASK